MVRKEFAGKSVVKAISVGLAAVMVTTGPMATMTTYAETPDEQIVAETTTAAEEDEEVTVQDVVKEIDDLTVAAGDVVIEVPLGFLGTVEVPVEPGVEILADKASKVLDDVDPILNTAEKIIDKKLDQSVPVVEEETEETEEDAVVTEPSEETNKDDEETEDNTEETTEEVLKNAGYDNPDTLVDDKVNYDMDKVDAEWAEVKELFETEFDPAIEEISEKLENGFASSAEAEELSEALLATRDDVAKEIADAREEYKNAVRDLHIAEDAYREAEKISEVAAKAAQARLDAAQAMVNVAANRAEALDSRLKAIDSIIDKAYGYFDSADKALEEVIKEAGDELDTAIDNLETSLDNLKAEDVEFDAAVEQFKGDIIALDGAAKEFVGAAVGAYKSQKELNDLYNQYLQAQKALKDAQAALEAAEQNKGDLTEEQVAELEKAMETADAEVNNLKELHDFNESLAKDLSDENYDAATEKLVGQYVAKEGQKVAVVAADDEAYGKYVDEEGNALSYVIVYTEDEEGNKKVEGRYAYNIVDGSIVVTNLISTTPDEYILDGENKVFLTVNAETGNKEVQIGESTVEVEGTEGDYFYTTDVDDVVVTLSLKKNNWPYTDSNYSFSVSELKYNEYAKKDLYYLESNPTHDFYADKDGNIVPIGKFTHGIAYNSTFKTLSNVKTVVIDGVTYEVVKESGEYVCKGTDITLIEDTNGNFFVKNALDVKETLETEREYKYNSDNEACEGKDSVEYFEEMDKKLSASYTIWAESVSTWAEADAKLKAYENAKNALNEDSDIVKEANRTDLIVKDKVKFDIPIIDITLYEKDFTYGDLAKLPRTALDLINIDTILNMEPEDQQAVVKDLTTIVTTQDNGERFVALFDAVSKLGGNTGNAYAALLVVLGVDTGENVVEDILTSIENNPWLSWIPGNITTTVTDFVRDLISEGDFVSPFQKDYANAWVDALNAKVNVVLSGINLADKAGDALGSSLVLVKETIEEGAAITDVTLKSLEVAVRAAALGGLVAADETVDLAKYIVGQLDSFVEDLEAKTAKAAKEAEEARKAVNELTITAPGSEELAIAREALDAAQERVNGFRAELRNARKKLKDATELADEAAKKAEELRKLEEEEELRRRQQQAAPVVTGDDEDDEDDTTPQAQLPILPMMVLPVLPAPAATTPAAVIEEVVEIEEEAVPEAPAPEVEEEVKEEVVEEPVAPAPVVEIADEETALAATAEESKMSWWWLLIVVILGGTGTALYAKYRAKKKATEEATEA